MKVIVAFDSFKGCMSASDACQAARQGLLRACPDAEVICLPMSDGGEGMVSCIAQSVNATLVSVAVHDPLMRPINAVYALSSDGKTAYMEMAAASGLTLLSPAERNPILTTTYGVGEMIFDAVCRGCTDIVMGIGGSATCDGGEGMIEFLRPHLPLPVRITVACDVSNPLFGPNGAAYVFAPQKGASPSDVIVLDRRLRDFAARTETLLAQSSVPSFHSSSAPSFHSSSPHPSELSSYPGAGAAGGLGYGLMAYLNATLTSGIDLMLDTIHFDSHITGAHPSSRLPNQCADLIITGEGSSDRQTLMGKVPFGILQRASRHHIPVALLSGAIADSPLLLSAGFSIIKSINEHDDRPLSVLMQKSTAMHNLSNTCKEIAPK
ncbi:MAG: glycerate kinase [Bacteroidales bacterium]|nr:glycerate kinase [Candidatus Liminaster caballi]